MKKGQELNTYFCIIPRTTSNAHENMMLPKVYMFVFPRNEGPSMDKRDEYWRSSMEMEVMSTQGMTTKLQGEISELRSHHNYA